MAKLLARIYLVSSGCILLCTGVLKILSALTETKVLGLADPMIDFLSNRQVLFFVGCLELVVSRILFSRCSDTVKASLIAWLAATFFVYRLGLWSIDFHAPCACLGRAGDWLRLDPHTVDKFMFVTLVYLAFGSVSILVLLKSQISGIQPRQA